MIQNIFALNDFLIALRGEIAEFKLQSQVYAASAAASSPLSAQRNHFDVLDGLNGGALLDNARELIRL